LPNPWFTAAVQAQQLVATCRSARREGERGGASCGHLSPRRAEQLGVAKVEEEQASVCCLAIHLFDSMSERERGELTSLKKI